MAVEVKVYCRKKKTNKIKQIDHIPKCFQLPRSASVSKPRTEFYLPICSFKELDPRSRKEIQSSVIVGCSDMANDTIRGTVDPFSTRSSGPQDRKQKTPTNGVHPPLTDVKLFGKRTHIQPCSNRNSENRDDALELTSNRSQLTESREVCTTPGADVFNHHDQLHERDNSSSSSRARSKRERKPKVHFDEVSYPLHTSRKVRRFRIMRSLGLAAPVGSPFNNS